jgi:hypothetical protein
MGFCRCSDIMYVMHSTLMESKHSPKPPHAPDIDDLHACELAVSIPNEALGEHVVGAGVGTVAVLGLSMAVVNAEDARPLYDSSSSNTESSSVAIVRERGDERGLPPSHCWLLWPQRRSQRRRCAPLQQHTPTQQHQPLQQVNLFHNVATAEA